MKLGTTISKGATPFARVFGSNCIDPLTRKLRPESNCSKMIVDFDNARYPKDYVDSVLDRIRKRGKYKQEK